METGAVRGAVQLKEDSLASMKAAVKELLDALYEQNRIEEEDIISIFFTVTSDIKAANPATCVRAYGHTHVPMLCAAEPQYPNSLERVIRVLLTFRCKENALPFAPVYLGATRVLRPDLST